MTRSSAAARLDDGGAGLTNANFSKLLPAVDADTKALLAGGALKANSSGVRACGSLKFALLPGHVALERGRKADWDSGELVAVSDPVSGTFSFRAAASLPGQGKPVSPACLYERMPTFNKWLAASTHVKDMLLAAGFMSPQQAIDYGIFEEGVRELNDLFQGFESLAKAKEAWQLFLVLDQDLRLAQFDGDLPWSHHHYQIKPHKVQLALAELSALRATARAPKGGMGAALGVGGVSAAGGAGGAGGAWGGGDGNRGPKSTGGASASSLASTQFKCIPEKFRKGVCLQFYVSGRCSREVCKFAAAHKCLLCGSEAHGTAACSGH
jgi:hypothetical protein